MDQANRNWFNREILAGRRKSNGTDHGTRLRSYAGSGMAHDAAVTEQQESDATTENKEIENV